MQTRWTVSQIGARQHYAVARGFVQTDNFNLLYTDMWSRWGREVLRRGNTQMRAFAGRHHDAIPDDRVVSFNLRSVGTYLAGMGKNDSVEAAYREYLKVGSQFAAAVAGDLRGRELDPQLDVFFGFNTGCLETFEMLRERGVVTICDQIDPAAVEERIIDEERQRWPGWERIPGYVPAEYWERLSKEWAAASMVLVNSRWSRDALVQQGVPAEKMIVLPIAYEPDELVTKPAAKENGPLTVLWLGTLTLRKGIQYLLQAAKQLEGSHPLIRILVAGNSLLNAKVLEDIPSNVQILGRLTRERTAKLYRQADVFVLPTLSDGFAITQLEAMGNGLPVIATPNCGNVVSDGEDGLIVPARDATALAAAIIQLDGDRALLRTMSEKAAAKVAQFGLKRRAHLLEEAVLNYRAGRALQPAGSPIF